MAMSGGVDSSVAALVLQQRGYEVIGISMDLFACTRTKERGCCSAADRRDARAVAAKLGIAYTVVDMRSRFREKVVAPFVEEYVAGRTPSPCIRCNEYLKFDALFDQLINIGATSHDDLLDAYTHLVCFLQRRGSFEMEY